MIIDYMVQGHSGRGTIRPWKYIVDVELPEEEQERVARAIKRNWLVRSVLPYNHNNKTSFVVILRFASLRRLTVEAVAKSIAHCLAAPVFHLLARDHDSGTSSWKTFESDASGNYTERRSLRALTA